MKKLTFVLLYIFGIYAQALSQEKPLSPENNPANTSLVKNENSVMSWFMLKDTLKIEIGKVFTQIQKQKEKVYIITTVDMKQSPSKWIDTTIVETQSLKPIYHSSFNQQRDMVLNFGDKVTGYYLDKRTGTKTQISEEAKTPYYDSNFYPQLIRWLPLKNGFSKTISIFDYNPTAKIGVITATVRNTVETSININRKERQVWKVEVTDEISNNSTTSTYYIDTKTRKILKQDIDSAGRKMTMELTE